MLRTPILHGSTVGNPIMQAIAQAGGRQVVDQTIEPGFMEIPHFSGDIMIWGRNAPKSYMGWPDIEGVDPYGVCDTPQQFMERFKALLEKDVRTFFVTFTHIYKEPGNAGKGGGWRWHKWGDYIGDGTPQCEYLDDEEGFEAGVYVYHIYQIDGPETP